MARKFLVPIDLTQQELQNARIQNLASAPSSPVSGQVYYNTTTNALYIYNGTAWTQAGGITYGTLSARPIASSVSAGTLYYATDNYLIYYSNGSTWQQTSAFGSITAQTSYGASSGDGTSTNYARADHTHGTPSLGTSTPNAISGASSNAGSASAPSKEDHVHAFTPAQNLSMAGYKLTNLGTPTLDTDASTKAYVDSVAQGLNIHDSVKAGTTASLASITGGTVTYNNGSSGVGATLTLQNALTTLDTSYTVVSGDRLLIKNEATQANNGIYTIDATLKILTRATDFDSTAEIGGGDFVFVVDGTTLDNTGWVCIDKATTVGTTPIIFTQFSGQGTYTAGNGLTLSNNQFSVNAGTGITTSGGTTAIDTSVVVRKYATSIGDGSNTSYTVTHSLSTRDVTVTVYDNSSPYAEVVCDVQHTSTSAITLLFSVAPTSNQYRVVVQG